MLNKLVQYVVSELLADTTPDRPHLHPLRILIFSHLIQTQITSEIDSATLSIDSLLTHLHAALRAQLLV